MVTYKGDADGGVVRFDKAQHLSRGRNGYFDTTGYNVYHMKREKEVWVQAINGKGDFSDALRLAVPADAWIGDALNAVLDGLEKRKQLPTFLGMHPLLDAMIAERMAA